MLKKNKCTLHNTQFEESPLLSGKDRLKRWVKYCQSLQSTDQEIKRFSAFGRL